jgi:hypothetical protein
MQTQRPSLAKEPRMRLKDSCTACAKSKLKCSRDKPMCRRCEHRGLDCFYSPSQRAGRTSSAAAAAAARQRPRSPLTPNTTTSPTPEAQNAPPNKAPTSRSPVYGPFNFFEAINSYGDDRTRDSDAAHLLGLDDLNFDTAMSDSMDFPMMDNFDLGSIFPGQSNAVQSSPTNFDGFSSLIGNFANASLPTGPPPSPFSMQDSDHTHFFEDKRPTFVRTHSCFNVALNILTVLLSSSPTACTQSLSRSQDSPLPTINSVVAKNKVTIEAISAMLICPCSLDEHLAAVISLIAFKVMAWYAAAARDAPQSSSYSSVSSTSGESTVSSWPEQVLHMPTTVGKYHLDGADQIRMRAQLVLSELHRVQRLVELLSKRLENVRQRTDATSGTESTGIFEDTISASIFVQLEADLRRRLLAVSKETMDILGRG